MLDIAHGLVSDTSGAGSGSAPLIPNYSSTGYPAGINERNQSASSEPKPSGPAYHGNGQTEGIRRTWMPKPDRETQAIGDYYARQIAQPEQKPQAEPAQVGDEESTWLSPNASNDNGTGE